MLVEPQRVKVRLSGANRKHLELKGYVYTKKGDEIEIDVHDLSNGSPQKVKFICDFCGEVFESRYSSLHNNEHQFCSRKCKCDWNSANPRTQIICNCAFCNKEVKAVPSQIKKSKSGNVFCSNECVGKYNGLRHKENRVQKVCLICNKEYSVKPSEANDSVTCSRECQSKWQSIYLVGENANNFNQNISLDERKVACVNCGAFENTFPYKIEKIKNGYNHFCSIKCSQEWYTREWSQREEWKEQRRIQAVEMLENGTFNHTDTGCQKVVNSILEELNIKYQNEYNCKYVSIDNYLIEHNLMIEVMGTFWHSDHRIYKQINYQNRVDGIKKDKIKRSYIKSQHGISILYLWEEDVMKNHLLCKRLIEKYVESKGIINNYHSFNYSLEYDELKLNKEIDIPYMEYDIEDLRKFINIKQVI